MVVMTIGEFTFHPIQSGDFEHSLAEGLEMKYANEHVGFILCPNRVVAEFTCYSNALDYIDKEHFKVAVSAGCTLLETILDLQEETLD